MNFPAVARDIRLLPIVIFAVSALFVLKAMALVVKGGGRLGAPAAHAQNITDTAPDVPDITGSVSKKEEKKDEKKEDKPAPPAQGVVVKPEQATPTSQAERAILEKLQERRQEIEALAKDIEMRENLLKAAEKKLDVRVNELKDLEARVNTAVEKRGEAEAQRFKGLVSMYETMKAKDAARIFDRLDIKLAVELAFSMKPAKLSDIMAAMSTEAAEKLTVEIAARSSGGAMPGTGRPASTSDLPKIEGTSMTR